MSGVWISILALCIIYCTLNSVYALLIFFFYNGHLQTWNLGLQHIKYLSAHLDII
jgi:hypothetical protein